MRHILMTFLLAVFLTGSQEDLPRGYETKTERLAENLVRCSKDGSYNRTYKALRKIQKYEFRLDKEELVRFYSDIHESVKKECIRQGLDEDAQEQMRIIIDALFSDELKQAANGNL